MIQVRLLIVILSALSMTGAWAGNASSVTIRVDSNINSEEHRSVSEFKLKRTPSGFTCRASAVPEHPVKPRGLKSITAPFKDQKISSECEHVLTWGKAKTCYERGANPVIDDVLRWCSQL